MREASHSHQLESRKLKATLSGAVAVLLWALLALFTTGTRGIPPFQVLALSFTVAFVLSTAVLAFRGRQGFYRVKQRPSAWMLSTAGLFGYHFFYFLALKNAPPVDASLIAYLWPLLIVVLSALLPDERLRWFHICGAVLGLSGAALLVTDGGQVAFRAEFTTGYLAAFACALVWSGYSVANRRFDDVPTEMIVGVCGLVAILGFVCHLALEQTVTPKGLQWLAILGLGAGPVGAAFFFWDYGTKHGYIQPLGAFGYVAPLLSTLFLIVFGQAELTWVVAAACGLIVSGAVLASRELLFRRRTAQT